MYIVHLHIIANIQYICFYQCEYNNLLKISYQTCMMNDISISHKSKIYNFSTLNPTNTKNSCKSYKFIQILKIPANPKNSYESTILASSCVFTVE